MAPSGDQDKIEQTLFFVAHRGWQTTVADFLAGLVAHLAETLDLEFAFIGRLAGKDGSQAETVALYARGEIVENIKYELKGTPCENVVGKTPCIHIRDIQKLFPEDERLTDMSAKSYIGIPLWASDGDPLGLMVVLGCSELKNPELASTLLQIAAVRAAAEIERDMSDKALHKSEERFRDFAESTSDWFWEQDADLRFTWVSPEFFTQMGIAETDIIGKTRREMILIGVSEEQWRQHDADLAARRPFRDFVVQRPGPEGVFRAITVAGKPVFDAQGEFKGYRGVGRDFTELKEREDALKESEQSFRAIAEGSPVPLLITRRADGTILYANSLVGPTLGLPTDAPEERKITEFFRRPSERDGLMARLDAAGFLTDVPLDMRRADGTHISTIHSLRGINYAGEQAVLASFQDVTESLRLEEQLRQAQKMEAVGQLTGGVAHDFNNLLTVVLGNLELLSERVADDETAFDYAGRAISGARRGAELTHRLLAFSRKQALVPAIIDPRELVDGMLDLIRRTIGETIEISVLGSDNLWRSEADPAQLESAVLNLAINARDAMPDGGKLTIETVNVAFDDESAAAQADVTAGHYVMVAVTDTGIGMPRHAIEHAFDPFFTTKEIGKGSGLGLSMVYGFAKQSGGHVTIYSEEGVGTTVKMYLPRSLEEADEAPVEEHEAEPRSRGETILVVEDDPDVRALAVALLSGLGYRILEAPDGRSALAALDQTSRVSMLFTDVVLPGGMSGPNLAAEVKRRFPGVAVLFTSGYTDNAIIHQDRLDKGVELLNKPFRKSDLARKIRSVLDRANT